MGKGNRAHVAFQPVLSSSDVLSAKLVDLPSPLYQPQKKKGNPHDTPITVLLTTYMTFFMIIVWGQVRDIVEWIFYPEVFGASHNVQGYAPLKDGFEAFFYRRIYIRARDCFNRPTTNVPGRMLTLLERVSHDGNKTFEMTGRKREMLNLASYNYLGFAQSEGPCADSVQVSLEALGVTTGSSRMEAGSIELHTKVEELVARFTGKEDAIVLSMGFATNSTTLPSLLGEGDLIVSDELNHSSIVFGARLSGATVKPFKHNDAKALEAVLRKALSTGNPVTKKPWRKVLVVLEGLYSMEGHVCCLPEIIELKKKYKFYIYLDEAHSIGAMGPNGRGVCDYFGVNPADIDLMMGTFTKSFGSAGGYIAADKKTIDHLRLHCHSSVYAEAMSVPVLQQIYTSMRIIMGEESDSEGQYRVQTLARNSHFFASELRKMKFIVYGDDSPIIPLLVFQAGKTLAFTQEMVKRGIAIVGVGYPAVSLISSRIRFCISASHTTEDLRYVLDQISEVGDLLFLKFGKGVPEEPAE